MMQMVMVDRNDDDNSHNDDGVDGNAVYDSKGGDEADNSNDQTESIAGDLAEYHGSSKLEMQ